jgi:hypothetical protein
MLAVRCAIILLVFTVLGCGKQDSTSAPTHGGYTVEELAIAREDEQVASKNFLRLMDEIDTLDNKEQKVQVFKMLEELQNKFRPMTESSGLPVSARWFRKQVEGKSAKDFIATK